MKAEELRIGNWINTIEGFAQIKAMSEEGLMATSIMDGGDLLGWADPIPLSEEWLLKFGFDHLGRERYTEYEDRFIYCLHNSIDGTSDFKVYLSESWYGVKEQTPDEILKHTEKHWGVMIDHDIIYIYQSFKYVHQLQNLYYALCGEELTITKN